MLGKGKLYYLHSAYGEATKLQISNRVKFGLANGCRLKVCRLIN